MPSIPVSRFKTTRTMRIARQVIPGSRSVQRFCSCLLVVSLCIIGAGCDGAGGNGEEGENGGNGENPSAPAAPSGLEGTSVDSAVELTWEAVDEEDLDGYRVYRDTESIGDVSGMDALAEGVLSDPSYTDDAADNGQTYYYVVTAVDTDSNESDPSNEVEKTPFSDPPNRP